MTGAQERVLVFHTAFIGDIVLMFPMLQVLREQRPESRITVVTVPAVVDLVRQHPAVAEVIPYDKRGVHRGFRGMKALAARLKREEFTMALIPHRSLRSAVVVRMAGIPRRIGFSTSAGAWLLSEKVPYRSTDHEIDRDLRLLQPVIGVVPVRVLPVICLRDEDVRAAEELLDSANREQPGFNQRPLVALAPGSVWLTKRWPMKAYGELAQTLVRDGCSVVLVGGARDQELCNDVAGMHAHGGRVVNAAGRLTLPGSAALLRRCRMLVTNDSAPAHIGMGVGIPVLALFGPTVPSIGFAPVGPEDRVLEVAHLPCRPCNIHGGNECPIGSFECMRGIPVTRVVDAVREIISGQHAE